MIIFRGDETHCTVPHNGPQKKWYHIKPDNEDLKKAMELYTAWFDEQLEAAMQAEVKEPKVKIPLLS